MEPFSWAAIGGVALTEGIKFCYKQAEELLRWWHDRKSRGAKEPPEISIVEGRGALDALPVSPARVDVNTLQEVVPLVEELVSALQPFGAGYRDVKEGGDKVGADAQDLRLLLEAVLGQQFTFRGEDGRPRTGTPVVSGVVDAKAIAARAKARGAHVGNVREGQVSGTVRADTVGEGAHVTGVESGDVG